MQETAGQEPGTRWVTVNQIVAWNIAWYRRRAGMTQKQLGDLLGWSNVSVSEAERSWDGRRVREFDAQTLAELCLALEIPLVALFLPPDDGRDYAFRAPDAAEGGPGWPCDMGDLVARIVIHDTAGDSPAMDGYRQRFRADTTKYLDPAWASEVSRWLEEADDRDARIDRAERLLSRHAELLETAAELASMRDAILAGLGPEEEK